MQCYIATSILSLSVATATPLNVVARRTVPTSIFVSWTAPTPAPVGYEVFYWRIASSNQHNGGTVTGTSATVPVQDFSPLTVEVVAFGGDRSKPLMLFLHGFPEVNYI